MWLGTKLRRKKKTPSRAKAIQTLVLHFNGVPKRDHDKRSRNNNFPTLVRGLSDTVIARDENIPIEVGRSSKCENNSDYNNSDYNDSDYKKQLGYREQIEHREDNEIFELPPLEVIVEFKHIKRLYLRVLPPNGEVKVSAPLSVSSQTVECFIEKQRKWIDKAQKRIYERQRPLQDKNENAGDGITGDGTIGGGTKGRSASDNQSDNKEINPNAQDMQYRDKDLDPYDLQYTTCSHVTGLSNKDEALKQYVSDHLDEWILIVGKEPTHITYRSMKTRWGSCTPSTGRIRLNTALAELDIELVRYVVIHELVHLHASGHGELFRQHMDRCLPNWRQLRTQLNKYSRTHVI